MIRTDIPARLDRLPWSPWHSRVVIALGVIWLLDGLEVTIVGAISGVLGEPDTLALSPAQIGAAGSAYLAGAIVGALVFGHLTDRFGRRRLFLITLGVYVTATLATAASWNFASFVAFRAITGAGIGGEYSAINSAIDELLPARVRGRADLMINGTYWLGTALGALSSLVLLDTRVLPERVGWRLAFGLGAILGVFILYVRRALPESPRWLLLHGRARDADSVMREIEKGAGVSPSAASPAPSAVIDTGSFGGLRGVAHVLFTRYRRRAILGFTLMAAQAFAYNAIFFTSAIILNHFYGVAPRDVGLYLLPFAVSNFLGPLVLGRLFDTVGRRPMIAATYAASALLLGATGWAFAAGHLSATGQTAMWCATFFVASAAASSSYLSVSELFPVELRGLAIAIFYSVGTAIGGVAAPALFGALISSGSRSALLVGYLLGAALLFGASVVALAFGVDAEGRSLEELRVA